MSTLTASRLEVTVAPYCRIGADVSLKWAIFGVACALLVGGELPRIPIPRTWVNKGTTIIATNISTIATIARIAMVMTTITTIMTMITRIAHKDAPCG